MILSEYVGDSEGGPLCNRDDCMVQHADSHDLSVLRCLSCGKSWKDGQYVAAGNQQPCDTTSG